MFINKYKKCCILNVIYSTNELFGLFPMRFYFICNGQPTFIMRCINISHDLQQLTPFIEHAPFVHKNINRVACKWMRIHVYDGTLVGYKTFYTPHFLSLVAYVLTYDIFGFMWCLILKLT